MSRSSKNDDKEKLLAIKKRVSQLTGVRLTELVDLGTGTYSYVIGISNQQVIKVYKDQTAFKNDNVDTVDFFEPGAFREIFFNPILVHPRIFKYDEVKHDSVIGLYKLGKRMRGTLYDLVDEFDKKMFICIMKDMVSALKHIHSYGVIHSDIKPANVLYCKTVKGRYIFKLCDFNIAQIVTCCTEDNKKFTPFATENYSTKEDIRDVSVDVYMLGSTLLNMCLNETHDHYNLGLLKKRKDDVIKKTDELCYSVLEMMLAPQKYRVYLHHIERILGFSEEVSDSGKLLSTLTSTTVLFDDNIKHYHNMCRDMITFDFFSRDPNNFNDYQILAKIHNETEKSNSTYETATKMLSKVIQIKYSVGPIEADFFAQSICVFPKDETIEDWADIHNSKNKKLTNYKNINDLGLKMCLDEMNLNYHLVTCNRCMHDISRILTPDDVTEESTDESEDNLYDEIEDYDFAEHTHVDVSSGNKAECNENTDSNKSSEDNQKISLSAAKTKDKKIVQRSNIIATPIIVNRSKR